MIFNEDFTEKDLFEMVKREEQADHEEPVDDWYDEQLKEIDLIGDELDEDN